ncbi:unnamed protein product [Haemonchus placei]|uniref:Uncharacterized protein n=1 Tax=Haemonchus placei TaxID=6290 RepID=A0A0N4X3A6_HAEPC|nr:unnamed protein product [Haemonchus placei]
MKPVHKLDRNRSPRSPPGTYDSTNLKYGHLIDTSWSVTKPYFTPRP